MLLALQAFVTAALFDATGRAHFALGDGTVRVIEGDQAVTVAAHDEAVLCATIHPSGSGLVTGGDDGRLVWTRFVPAERKVLVTRLVESGPWVDAVAASAASGLIAYAAGKTVTVLDAADPAFARRFTHERSAAGLAFDAKGKRLAVATYGGAWLWWARIAEQKPQVLKWAGSHIEIGWSPDGRFLVTAMQDNQLHAWRLTDAKDLRMGGYPAKIKSMAFLDKGQLLVTSGANGAIVWPFAGPNGPIGREAAEIGHREGVLVTRVAGAADASIIAAGMADGAVWGGNLRSGNLQMLKADVGPAISALALAADGARLAWGDEEGGAGVLTLADLD